MAEYPREFDFDVVLKDGSVVRMRPIRPDDAEAEDRFVRRTSAESNYFRFFRYRTELTPEEIEHFTNVDYEDRMAFVVVADDEIIGVGRYDVLDDDTDEPGRAAEVAFLVEDAFQGRGIGTLLIQQLAMYARMNDITAFRAYVLADNRTMLNVFASSGYGVTRELADGGTFELELPTAYSAEARTAADVREKWAIATSLTPLFKPRAVAVVGASRDEASIGGRLFHNLINSGFNGPVYPVNPSAGVVRSVRAYPSVLDVPDDIDTVFIAVPAPAVVPVAADCVEKGVKSVVVISAGFAETGPAGVALERRLVETVRSGGMRMVGPNCMGFLNTEPNVRLNGQFGPVFPPHGNVAMSSQSGALGLAILSLAKEINIGISSFVSVGNKADVSGNDLLLYWEEDPTTEVILLYLESFGNPRRFGRIARRVGRTKPIIALKSGRSAAGARAAASHTGSLANVEVAVDALFQQTGVIRTDTLDEMFDVASLLASQPVPAGRRVAILTNAGGPGILCADALEARGIVLPQLSPTLQDRLHEILPAEASTTNPVDMIASAGPENYEACLDVLLDSDELDAVIVIYIPASPGGSGDVAEAIKRSGVNVGDTTLLTVFMQTAGGPGELSDASGRIPSYPYPESAARALAAAVSYGEWRAKPEGTQAAIAELDGAAAESAIAAAAQRATAEAGSWLMPDEIETVLAACGIPTVDHRTVTTADEAVEAAAAMGGPVVMKLIAPSVVHKSDVGGVVLNVEGPAEVRSTFTELMAIAEDADGVLVQEYVSGHEVIIGMTEDATFGPLIGFGLGGVYVELLRDVAFRIHPLTTVDVDEMIGEVRSARLLEGYRGSPPADIVALKDVMFRIDALIERFPEIEELDLNPVMVLEAGRGVRVVDARVKIRTVGGRTWLPSRKDIPGQITRRDAG